MNRTAFVTETSPRANVIVGGRVKFNERSLAYMKSNLDIGNYKKLASARGVITKKLDENRCQVLWDNATTLFGRKDSPESLMDLEDEGA